jgi:hypothetical protein
MVWAYTAWFLSRGASAFSISTLDVLYLIDLFNLIEFFGFAAIFGWLTFARLNDEEIKKLRKVPNEIKEAKEERESRARTNLYALGNLFLISFLFYSVAAIADYLFWHMSNPLNGFLTKPLMFSVTLTSFVIATLVLPVPFVIVASIPRLGRDIGDLRLAPFDVTLALCVLAALSNIYAWNPHLNGSTLPHNIALTISWTYFFVGFAPYLVLYLGLRYYWKGDRTRPYLIPATLAIMCLPIWVDTATRIRLLLWLRVPNPWNL